MKKLKDRKDELNEVASTLERVDDKGEIDEEYDDIVKRYEQLESRFNAKEKQVIALISEVFYHTSDIT